MKRTILFILFILLLVSISNAEFKSDEDINMLGNTVYNASNINATNFYQNGNSVLDNTSAINNANFSNFANSSTYWDDETSQADLNVNSSTFWVLVSSFQARWFYELSNILTFNESRANTTYINAGEESGLNVNSSDYWDTLNSPTDINAGDITDDGTYILSSDEGNLNVNTSNSTTFWAGVSSFISKWFYDNNNVFTFNETQLNNTIEIIGNQTYVNIDGDTMTGNLGLSTNNLTNMSCIILTNGEPICWNVDAYTIDIPSGLGNTIQSGQELTLVRKNTEGKAIYEGQLVYSSGSQGEMITVGLADASNGSKIHNIGMVTIPVCNNNAVCPITYFGNVNDLDTTIYNCVSLYVSDDGSGNVTCNLPTGDSYHILIGDIKKNHSTIGIIDFNPEIDYSDEPVFNNLKVLNNLNVDNNITSTYFFGIYDWIIKAGVSSSYLNFNGTEESFNESKLNNTIDNKIAALSIEYNATSFNVSPGNIDSGNLTSTQTCNDVLSLNISEVSGIPGFIVYFNFTNVTAFNNIHFIIRYDGGQGHSIDLEFYNNATSSWKQVNGDFTDTDGFVDVVVPVFSGTEYIDGNLLTQFRFNHDDNGIISHDFFIDCIHLVQQTGISFGGEHDATTGRDNNGNHPQYLLIDGSRNMTGNLDTGGFNITVNTIFSNIIKSLDWTNVSITSSQITDIQNFNESAEINSVDLRVDSLNSTKANLNDAVTFTTVNTGQGANELYDMDQNVLTSSNVIFNSSNVTTQFIGQFSITDNGTHLIIS